MRRSWPGAQRGFVAVTVLLLLLVMAACGTEDGGTRGANGSEVNGSETEESVVASEDDVGIYRYGDDPVLDALWDDCAAGDAAACDDLYLQSPVGSQYERFGDTCGGRNDGGGCGATVEWSDAAEAVCAQLYETAGTPPPSGADYDDDMALFEDWHAELLSDAVSELEAIGAPSADEQGLTASMDEFARITSRAAQIYASQVLYSEELNTIVDEQGRLIETISADAATLGVPSCGRLVDYG